MKTLDLASSLFWLFVSIAVFVESLRLGIGTLRSPGMGFMTFAASGILGILSLTRVRTLKQRGNFHNPKGGYRVECDAVPSPRQL